MGIVEKVTFSSSFISALQRAWPTDDRQFNAKDEKYYNDNLIGFCNDSVSNPIPSKDYYYIFDFISLSISHFVDLVVNDYSKIDYVNSCTNSIMTLLDHLAVNCVSKPTQVFFEKQLSFLLNYSCSLDDDSLDDVLDYYERSNLFEKICFYIQTLSQTIIDEDLINSFMKRLRRHEKEKLFQFILFPLNNKYFRQNLKIYPDECNSKELYYGIHSRYFVISLKNDVYSNLLNMCNSVSDDIINKKSLLNPIYVYWTLLEENYPLSTTDIYPYIDRLFCH